MTVKPAPSASHAMTVGTLGVRRVVRKGDVEV
jgi:hypothetical protein